MDVFNKVYLGLGSNIGNRALKITQAVNAVKKDPHFKNVRVSRFYESTPVGPRQKDFVNAALSARTSLSPEEVLRFVKAAEKRLGRKKRKLKWGPREIDIDILFYGGLVQDKPALKLPHPEIEGRLFVLAPLSDIAPGLRHPVLKKTVRTLKNELLLTYKVQKDKIPVWKIK